jgi:hypothetical protein
VVAFFSAACTFESERAAPVVEALGFRSPPFPLPLLVASIVDRHLFMQGKCESSALEATSSDRTVVSTIVFEYPTKYVLVAKTLSNVVKRSREE